MIAATKRALLALSLPALLLAQNPVVRQSPVVLMNAVAATGTATSSAIRLPNNSGYGSLMILGAGITGSPVGCQVTLAYQESTGGATGTVWATQAFTPASSLQQFNEIPSSVVYATGEAMVAVYSCATTYPSAGTITVTWAGNSPVSVLGTVPVSGTFFQATQPVSAAALPLPSGAATSAKQPALGTAGSASADVITVQGVASMTALKVDGSGVTQPVSGTVTTTPPANASSNVAQINGVTPLMGAGNGGTGSLRVNVATDQVAIPASQSGTWTVQPGNTANTTAWKVDGSAVTQPVSGTVTVTPSGTQTVAGNKTNNNAAPGATNVGALVAISNSSAPSMTEGNLVALSVDNSGALRTTASAAAVNDVTATASLTATGSATTATLNGANTVGIYLSGTWVATVQFEASVDGTNYFSVNGLPITGGALVTSATANGQWQVDAGGYANVRARVSAFTSGTVVINLRSSTGGGLVSLNSSLPAGTNVIGHVIHDTGSTTAVTQATASNLNAAVVGVGTAGSASGGVVTVQGVASMTKLLVTPDSVALPANQSVNVAQMNGVTTTMGNGVAGTGVQRVAIASDNTAFAVNSTLSAETTKIIGETIPVTTATTTDSALTSATQSAASTNSTSVKGSAGNVYGYYIINTTTTNYFLRMYNLAAGPTCSSATGFVETIPALGAAANGGGISRYQVAQSFTTGIAFCLTGGGSSTDNTNAATGVYVTILYK